MTYQISYDANVGLIALVTGTYNNILLVTTAGYSREGTYSYRLRGSAGSNFSYMRTPFITATATPAISMWGYMDSLMFSDLVATRGFEVALVTTTGQRISALWNKTNKTFDIYVDGSLVKAGDAGAITDVGLFNLRMYGTIADSGAMAVNINGREIAVFSGDTLPSGSDATIAYVEFKCTTTAALAENLLWLSCISLNDGGLDPGDRRVYVKLPTGDSAVQWNRSTGSTNYEILDNVPPTTAYVYTTTNAKVDKLALADIGDVHAVNGVTKFIYGKKTTGDAQTVLNGVDSNGTVDTTENVLTTENAYHYHIMTVDPDTSAAFTKDGVNALLTYRESVI